MEEAFFQAIQTDNIEEARKIFENGHIDVMFNDNCVMKYAVEARKLHIIKWLMELDDFMYFGIDDIDAESNSLMELACKHKYYELVEYLHEQYTVVTCLDLNVFISGCFDAGLVTKLLSTFQTDDNFDSDSIFFAETPEIIDAMLQFRYTLDARTMTINAHKDIPTVIVSYAHEHGFLTLNHAKWIFVNAVSCDRIHTCVYIYNAFPGIPLDELKESLHEALEQDPITCIRYLDTIGFGISSFSGEIQQELVNYAMLARAEACVRFFHERTGVSPSEYSDIFNTYEYTKLAMEYFPITCRPTHLACTDTKLFDIVLDNVCISDNNIDACILAVTLSKNRNAYNMRRFYEHLHTLDTGIVGRKQFGNIFVMCCLSHFLDIAKDIMMTHGHVLSDATITNCEGGDEEIVRPIRLHTPKRVINELLCDDESIETVKWLSHVYDVKLKFSHVVRAMDDAYGENPKMLLFLLQNTEDLHFHQLKHVFSGVMSNYEDNAYYISKYLKEKYADMITPELTSILFKNAVVYTHQTYKLFEDCTYSVRSCLKHAIYGDNLATFKHLIEKHMNYNIRSKNDELFRYACLTDSIIIVKYMCDMWEYVYSYTIDDEDIIPMIKDSVEYFVHKNEMQNILKKMKKKTGQEGPKECAVCYDVANVYTQCNHTFCITCISKWYIRNPTCPMCKQSFTIGRCKKIIVK